MDWGSDVVYLLKNFFLFEVNILINRFKFFLILPFEVIIIIMK